MATVEEKGVRFVESRIFAEYGLESAIMEGRIFFAFFTKLAEAAAAAVKMALCLCNYY